MPSVPEATGGNKYATFLTQSAKPPERIASEVFDELKIHHFSRKNEKLAQIFSQITEVGDLTAVLEEIAKEAEQSGDPYKIFERIAEVVDLPKLEKAILSGDEKFKGFVVDALKALRSAESELERTGNVFHHTLHSRTVSALKSMMPVLESILASFGIASIFQRPENDVHQMIKGQKLLMVMQVASVLTVVLVPLLGGTVASYVVGGIFLSVAFLSLIYGSIQPTTSVLSEGKNWTEYYRSGKLKVNPARQAVNNATARVLSTTGGAKTHPLYLGESGAGKTEQIKSFIEAVERGDYPELKGKTFFYFNTADLTNHSELFSSGNRILETISQTMGANRDNCVLILDEFHEACKNNSPLGDKLKLLLDDGVDSFPHVIGITTYEDYAANIYVNHNALTRRFTAIGVDSTDESTTLDILRKIVLREGLQSTISEEMLQYLWEQTKTQPQPITAVRILTKCFPYVSGAAKGKLQEEIELLKDEKRQLDTKSEMDDLGNLSEIDEARLLTIKEQLLQKTEELEQETQKLMDLREMHKKAKSLKSECNKRALRISCIQNQQLPASVQATEEDKRKMKSLMLLRYFMRPAVQKKARVLSEELGVADKIDETLIDQVMQEEKETQEGVEANVRKGQEARKAREAKGKDEPVSSPPSSPEPSPEVDRFGLPPSLSPGQGGSLGESVTVVPFPEGVHVWRLRRGEENLA